MVVTGTADAPVLGIVDEAGAGVDLADCPLYPPIVHAALAQVPALIKRAQLPPYNIAKRKGELKYVLVTAGDAVAGGPPAGRPADADVRPGEPPVPAVMVRFVLRTAKPVERIREHLHLLTDHLGTGSVVTVNIQPDPKAVIEGQDEIHLFGPQTLAVTQGSVQLRLRPQSFLQTNSAVAGGLYQQVADWIDAIAAEHAEHAERGGHTSYRPTPLRVWDLFCGVGGFALHVAGPAGTRPHAIRNAATASPANSRSVTGVEIAPQAVESARATAAAYGLDACFHAADAAAWAAQSASEGTVPDVLIVNPPRRGLGQAMARWIQHSGIPDVVYSSCNPATLARDLETMDGYRITAARLLDMFPHTRHAEVVVRLRRQAPSNGR